MNSASPAEREPIVLEDLEIKRVIRHTESSSVYLAFINGNAENPAVFKTSNGKEKSKASMRNEVRELADAQDVKGVIPLLASSNGNNKTQPFIIMPYIAGGNMIDRFRPQTADGMDDKWNILAGIARSIAGLHAMKVAHRDIKPANMLADDENISYLIDFGQASYRFRLPDDYEWGNGRGTLKYASPERLNGSMILLESDVFSFGVSVLEVLTGEHPWLNNKENPHKVGPHNMRKRALNNAPYISRAALSRVAPERLEFAFACIDPFFQNRPPITDKLSSG